jgi:hypothetical protein
MRRGVMVVVRRHCSCGENWRWWWLSLIYCDAVPAKKGTGRIRSGEENDPTGTGPRPNLMAERL